jgi:hypothetical protein
MATMSGRGRNVLIGFGAVVLAGVVLLYTTSFGKGVRDVAGSGAVQDVLVKPPKRTYDASDSDANLKALGTAMRLYHESEGAYPQAAGWMDAIEPRLILNDLPKKEADKKLHRPDAPEGAYGYAMNDAASGKYRGDLPKGTILLFESTPTGMNAHGDPTRDGKPGGRAVTIEGDAVALKG